MQRAIMPFLRSLFGLGLNLAVLGSTGCGSPPPLTVQSYAGDPNGFAPGAHLVLGEREAILVDTGFVRADADQIVSLVRASGRTLRMIVLTHAHPDHYFGAQIITAAFPGVPFVTTARVLADFQTNAPGTFAALKQQLGDLIADALVTPTALSGSEISLEGHRLRVFEQPTAGESSQALILGLDEPRALLTGDLVYNNVHLVLPGCQADGWKQDLAYVRSLGYSTIYPGHGGTATSPAVLDAVSQYIDRASAILDQAATADAAKSQIAAEYSNYTGAGLLDLSTSRYFQNCRN